MAQSQFNIAQDALEKRLRLLLCKHDIVEPGSWIAHSTDILHQDRVPDLRERPGHVSAMCIEQALCLILVLDPRCYLGGTSSLGLACCSAAAPAVTMLCLPLFIVLDICDQMLVIERRQ